MTTANQLAALGNGPAFSAYKTSNQSFTGGVYTKVIFETELFDTNNNFASSRFTPTVAGYYSISYLMQSDNSASYCMANIYKNGSIYQYGTINLGTASVGNGSYVGGIIYMNGTTDYLEFYAYQNSNGTLFSGTGYNLVSGALVRSA